MYRKSSKQHLKQCLRENSLRLLEEAYPHDKDNDNNNEVAFTTQIKSNGNEQNIQYHMQKLNKLLESDVPETFLRSLLKKILGNSVSVEDPLPRSEWEKELLVHNEVFARLAKIACDYAENGSEAVIVHLPTKICITTPTYQFMHDISNDMDKYVDEFCRLHGFKYERIKMAAGKPDGYFIYLNIPRL